MFSARAHGRDLARVNWVYFAAFLAFAAAEFTLVFLAVERFHFSHGQNAAMFVYVGLWIAGIQGGALRALAPRFGDRKLALAGHVLIAPGFLLVGIAGNALTLYAGLTAMAVGSALVVPALSALASRFAPPGRQGFALGAFRSVGSLSRALGPILGCLLYWRFGSSVPYLAAAAFLVLPFLVLHTVREPVRAGSEPSTPH